MATAQVIIGIVIVLLVVTIVVKSVRIVPQARAGIVERLGRYLRTLEPGLNFLVPFVDRVKPLLDLREQVVSFEPRSVITEDNLVVDIDTVLYFQVTNPRDATYEIANYIQGVEQLTVTTLRNVAGGMDLETVLTSREEINSQLRGVLDEATGKWGIRVTRVEIKAIDPPKSIKEAMEKQMRAERDKRAAILNAEGFRQSQILSAEGEKQSAILKAEGGKQAAILSAEGEARAIDTVFNAVHEADADPKLLAYKYLQTLPKIAENGNATWVIPGELTSALRGVSDAFSHDTGAAHGMPRSDTDDDEPPVDDAAAAAEREAAAAEREAAAARREASAAEERPELPEAGYPQLPSPLRPPRQHPSADRDAPEPMT